MKTDHKPPPKYKYYRTQLLMPVLMLLVSVTAGALAWSSIANETLYSPLGILATENSDPTFYLGISVYITIGATLLTAALIRLALKLSK